MSLGNGLSCVGKSSGLGRFKPVYGYSRSLSRQRLQIDAGGTKFARDPTLRLVVDHSERSATLRQVRVKSGQSKFSQSMRGYYKEIVVVQYL